MVPAHEQSGERRVGRLRRPSTVMATAVPPSLDGERADLVVARLAGLTRSRARRLVEAGEVRVDGIPVVPSQRLSEGAVVEFSPPGPSADALAPEPVAFGVLYEDRHLAVVDKPAGLVTHPGAGTAGATLASGILHRWPRVRGVGDEGRWGIVHRLDKDTSGALVVALDPEAFAGLRSALRRRQIERRYLALVHGAPSTVTGTIDAPLGPDPRRRGRRTVVASGAAARTHYRVVGSASGLSLLEVTLESGRTHQIRVHLAAVGLPIAGDRVYGRAGGSPRLFLHAVGLAFVHPTTGQDIEVEAPIPPDLARVLDELGIGLEPVG
jgi:23S rRNA pseudouridine1911/1915/1917 synthase